MVERIVGERYKLLRELGRGAFGQTYLAQDLENPTHPKCVVKELKPQASDELTLREAKRLFGIEAQVLDKLGSHPQIPSLLAYSEESFYLVQEFIDGHDLSKEIRLGEPLSEANVRDMLKNILPILGYIHEKHVIHRDIKPSNIRRSKDGTLVLIDFGAVKEIQTIVLTNGHAKPSIVAGTQGYMPPEQLRGRPRFNSDIYALGLIAVQALTGKSPMQLAEDPESGRSLWQDEAPNVSPHLRDVIERMICPQYSERYQTASEVLDDLISGKTKVKPSSKAQRKWWRWVAAAAGILVLAGGALSYPFARAIWLYNQANNLVTEENYLEAIALYEEVLDTLPNAAPVWLNRGFALSQLKRFQEQLNSCQKAVEIDPEFVEAHNCIGLAWHNLDQQEKAIAAFNQVVDIEPDFFQAWNNKGEALMDVERPREALESFDTAILYQGNYLFAWNGRGNALMQLERYPEAVVAYGKAIEIDTDYQYAWNGRGNAHRALKRFDEALSDYQTATDLAPNFFEAWYNQGLALLALDRPGEAIVAFDRAIEVKPDYRAAIEKREEVRQRLGI